MFLFRNSRAKSDIPPPADRLSFERIQKHWEGSCVTHNIELPGKVQAEFKKRIKQFGSVEDCGKAKLNLSRCDLDDQMVLFLIEALSDTPSIARLDLSGNHITDKSAICLIRLLLMQAKMVRQTQPKDRPDAIFLSEILLLNNKTVIEQRILDDITTVSDCLHHANVKSIIQRSSNNSLPFTMESIEMLCMSIMGKQIDENKVLLAISEDKDREQDSDDLISYKAIEDLIISELVITKILNPLSESQVKQISVRPAVQQRNASRWIMSGQELGPITDTSPSADHDEERHPELGEDSLDEKSEDFDEIYRDQIGWDSSAPFTVGRSPEGTTPFQALALTSGPPIQYEDSDSDSSDSSGSSHYRVSLYPTSKMKLTSTAPDRTPYVLDGSGSNANNTDETRRSDKVTDSDTDTRKTTVNKIIQYNSLESPRGQLVGEDECKESSLETFVDNMSDMSGVDSSHVNTPRANLMTFVYDMTPTKEKESEEKDKNKEKDDNADTSSEKSSDESLLSAFPVHNNVPSHPLPLNAQLFVVKKASVVDTGQEGVTSVDTRVSPRYLLPLASGTSRHDTDKTEQIVGTEMGVQDKQLVSTVSVPSSPRGALPTIIEEMDTIYSISPPKILPEDSENNFLTVDQRSIDVKKDDILDRNATSGKMENDVEECYQAVTVEAPTVALHDLEVSKLGNLFEDDRSSLMKQSAEVFSPTDKIESILDDTGYPMPNEHVSADATDMGGSEVELDSRKDLSKSLTNGMMSDMSDDPNYIQVEGKGLVKSMVLVLESQKMFGIIPPDIEGIGACSNPPADISVNSDTLRHSPSPQTNCLSPLTPSPSSRHRGITKSVVASSPSLTASLLPSPVAALSVSRTPLSLVSHSKREVVSAFRARLIANIAEKEKQALILQKDSDVDTVATVEASSPVAVSVQTTTPSPTKALNFSNLMQSDADWSTFISPIAPSASPQPYQQPEPSATSAVSISSTAPYTLLLPQTVTPTHSSASVSASMPALINRSSSDSKEERVRAFRAKLIAKRAARNSFTAACSPPISPFRDDNDSNVLSPASLGMSMASTPTINPGNAFGLPLQKALSLLQDTLPMPPPVPVPVPPPAEQEYPPAPSRKGSGIIYKSRDDDSSLFQLASAIVLPDEFVDVADVIDVTHDVPALECLLCEKATVELGAIGDNGPQEDRGTVDTALECLLVHPTELQPLQTPEGVHTVTTEAVTVGGDDAVDKGHGAESEACVRVKRSSAIPLPIPREKILIKDKGPNTDNPFEFVIDRSLDVSPPSGRKLPVKIDILRGPKRTPGSGPGPVSEGSIASNNSSHNAPDAGPGSPYGFDDYTEYPQGDIDGLGQGTYFADDNPSSHSSSKRDSGRLCDFSGPLGIKIKESIMMNMSVESMEAYVEQLTALEGVKLGSTQPSLGSPTAAPKALSKTCPEMHSYPAPRHNPLSVSVPSLSSKPSALSPPSSPSHSCPPERKYRSISPVVLGPTNGIHAATLSPSTYPPSPISRALRSEASTLMQKILSSSATSFSTFLTPNGALKGSPKGLAVDVEREPTVATSVESGSTTATPEKAKNTPRLEMGTRSRSGSITASKGSNPTPVQGKSSDGPVASRQLWTKPVPSNSNAYTNFLKSSVTRNVEVGVEAEAEVEVEVEASVEVERDIEVITNSEQCKSDSDSHQIDCKDDGDVKDRMSSTIYNPDDEKRMRNSRASANSKDNGHDHSSSTSKGFEKEKKEEKKKKKEKKEKEVKEEMEGRNDFLLDLTDRHLTTFNASLHHLYPRSKLSLLCVLILRNNQLTDLASMRLKEMVCVTDLDLAFNRFKGAIPHSVLPRNLERLDLEGNGFHDFSGLVTCNALKCVNISHNQINDISALPPKVTNLDISHNQLSSPLHLRLLSLTPSIITLRIAGNPIAEVSAFCRVIVCSVLPNIQQLDDVFIPGCGVRRKHLIADKGNGIPVKGGPQQRVDLSQSMRSTSKALQEEKDNRRHDAHAKKMKAAGRAQDNVQRHIRVISTTAPLGPQATELMVRRLTWVPPDKATAASFFGTSVAQSGLLSNEKAQSMKNGELTGTGARTDTRTGARVKSEIKDRTETGRMGGKRPASAQPLVIKSKPSLRRDSNDRLSSPARPVTASPAPKEHSLRQGVRDRDNKSKEGRSSDKPSRSAEDSSIKPSRSLETSSFSTFGASKCSSISRSNSAHRMSSAHPDTFKPFSRHSELPPSPGRDKRNAVLVVNKWLQDSVQELGKASVVLGLAFWITEQPRIESNSGINFSAAMDSVPFLREMTAERCQGRGPRRASRGAATASIGVTGHTSKLDKALEVVASGTSSVHGSSDRDDYLYLLAAVEAAKGNMESFTYVLTEIEKAVHLANRHRQDSVKPRQILLDLREQLEDIMCSTKGRIVNELVLAPFGCQLVWHGDQKDIVDEKITTVCVEESPGPSEQSEIEGVDEDEDKGEEECKGGDEYRDFTNSSTDSVTTLEMSMIPLTGSPTPSVSSKPSYTDMSQGSYQTVRPVLTVIDPVPTPAPVPVSSTTPTPSPAFATTSIPALIPEIYTHDMLDEETIKTINALNNGFYRDSRASEKPCKASPSYGTGAPSTSSPPTAPRTPTRVSAENDTPQVVAQHMDPLIQRFRLKYGLAVFPPAAVPHSDMAGMAGHTSITQGPITTMFQTNFGRFSSPEVLKTQPPNTQSQGNGNGQSHSNGDDHGSGIFPPSPPPFNPSPVSQKGYFGSFVASPEITKMQMQLRNLCTPKPFDGISEKVRKGTSSFISEVSYGAPARPFRSPGVSKEGNISQQTAPQLALSENSSSGCSIEFLTGEHVATDIIKEEDSVKEMFGHKSINSGHEILLGRSKPLNSPSHTRADTHAAATSHSTPTSGSRPRIPEGSPLASREKDSNFLDYDDIYHNSDTAIYTTDAQAAHVSSFKKGNQIRESMDTLKSFEGTAMSASSRLGKGVDNESDRFSSSRPFYTELDTAPHNNRSEVASSPSSSTMRVPQSSSNAAPDASSPVLRIRPSIHISPSFGFTNSYSEPVPLGRCKSSKTLTHAPIDINDKDKDSLDMSRKSSIAGDEMIVPSPSFKKTKGPITFPAASTCPSSPAIISTLRSRILVTSPEIAKVSSLSKAASIDTYTSNPMRNSFVMPEGNSPGGPFRAMHGSPGASKNMPCFDLRFSAPPSPSPPSPRPTESPSNRLPSEYPDSSFVSVNKRRESIDRLHIEFQNQIAASALSSSARKAPAASIDIRGYNSEAAMAVKARLATPATPARRRYSIEAVSAEIADRLRTLSEPSLPLCLVVGELV